MLLVGLVAAPLNAFAATSGVIFDGTVDPTCTLSVTQNGRMTPNAALNNLIGVAEDGTAAAQDGARPGRHPQRAAGVNRAATHGIDTSAAQDTRRVVMASKKKKSRNGWVSGGWSNAGAR